MKVLVSGSNGLIGSALVPVLGAAGHDVLRLFRWPSASDPAEVSWDPLVGRLDAADLEGLDAVVHLAGETLAEGRWTKAKRARIRDSRVQGTRLLAETLARTSRRPEVLVCASAVGYYGDCGEELLDEGSPLGSGFLAEVCHEWEAATRPAAEAGVRVVCLRIGPTLSPRGGMLGKMLVPFRLGLGGRVGSGRQYLSWITLDDLVGAILHVLTEPSLEGPVNAVGPQPVTNREFTRTLGRVLGRPTLLPAPAFMLRLIFGQMADALLLRGARVAPRRLLDSGYTFGDPDLEDALRRLLDRKVPPVRGANAT